MKSLREWIIENQDMGMGMGINRTSATNVLGGTTSTVDPKIKQMLRSEMERIIKANEGLDPLTLFREIMSAVIALMENIKSTRITAKNIQDLADLGSQEEENAPQV